MDVDHKTPVTPLTITTKEFIASLTIDEMKDVLWCVKNNLQVLCPTCHTNKSKSENASRRLYKKGKLK